MVKTLKTLLLGDFNLYTSIHWLCIYKIFVNINTVDIYYFEQKIYLKS
jgi:hypothetical protein